MSAADELAIAKAERHRLDNTLQLRNEKLGRYPNGVSLAELCATPNTEALSMHPLIAAYRADVAKRDTLIPEIVRLQALVVEEKAEALKAEAAEQVEVTARRNRLRETLGDATPEDLRALLAG